MSKRYIIIEGGIGAGKTTLLNILQQNFFPNAKFIYEYIETEMGKKMFNKFINGKLDVVTFQYYIGNYWLNELSNNDNNLIFMERGPLAGLAFCNEKDFESRNQYINFIKFLKLIMKENNIDKVKFIAINANDNINNIIRIINDSNENIVLFITASSKVLRERVIKRARKGEEEKYKEIFLMENANKLSNIYLYPNDIIKDLIN